MYVNIKLFQSKGLLPQDLFFLVAIKQTEKEVLETIPNDVLSRFEQLSLITSIKGSPKENPLHKLRLSKEGKELMVDLEEAPMEEQDEVIFLWLAEHYKNIGKEIGNGARTKRHLRDFRVKSGIQKNNLIKLILHFIQDEDNMQYNNVLEYSLYKPLTAFQTKFNLEDSRLWKHFQKHKNEIEAKFEVYE